VLNLVLSPSTSLGINSAEGPVLSPVERVEGQSRRVEGLSKGADSPRRDNVKVELIAVTNTCGATGHRRNSWSTPEGFAIAVRSGEKQAVSCRPASGRATSPSSSTPVQLLRSAEFRARAAINWCDIASPVIARNRSATLTYPTPSSWCRRHPHRGHNEFSRTPTLPTVPARGVPNPLSTLASPG
jgi:hypothetical protein